MNTLSSIDNNNEKIIKNLVEYFEIFYNKLLNLNCNWVISDVFWNIDPELVKVLNIFLNVWEEDIDVEVDYLLKRIFIFINTLKEWKILDENRAKRLFTFMNILITRLDEREIENESLVNRRLDNKTLSRSMFFWESCDFSFEIWENVVIDTSEKVWIILQN